MPFFNLRNKFISGFSINIFNLQKQLTKLLFNSVQYLFYWEFFSKTPNRRLKKHNKKNKSKTIIWGFAIYCSSNVNAKEFNVRYKTAIFYIFSILSDNLFRKMGQINFAMCTFSLYCDPNSFILQECSTFSIRVHFLLWIDFFFQ